jgi:peroxiredoxin
VKELKKGLRMFTGKQRLLILSAAAAVCIGYTAGCKEKPKPAPDNAQNETASHQTSSPQQQTEPNATVTPTANPQSAPKLTLAEIIARRRGWLPAHTSWYGRQAPDFTVKDISGKSHTLSEYKGKNVILIFWATWCGPCIQEIPHLIELRNTTAENKLAMLAISFSSPRESAEKVKNFVAANPTINYTVISTDRNTMPSPYNFVNAIPSSFFIDPEGRLKLATEGLIPLSQIKAIIEAER